MQQPVMRNPQPCTPTFGTGPHLIELNDALRQLHRKRDPSAGGPGTSVSTGSTQPSPSSDRSTVATTAAASPAAPPHPGPSTLSSGGATPDPEPLAGSEPSPGFGKVRIVSLLEGLPTQLSSVLPRLMIVPLQSAYPGFGEMKTFAQEDHISICKPSSKEHPAYLVVEEALRTMLAAPQAITAQQQQPWQQQP